MENRIYVNCKEVDSWKNLLANPQKQWKIGYSARTLAYCWIDGLPKEINNIIKPAKCLLVMPEYKVDLPPKGSKASQNDIFILANHGNGLSAIMVEGKVNEPFDEKINCWMDSEGKKERLKFLCEKLEIAFDCESLGQYRYQLFHRTVSAILAAEDFCATKAIMLVHSFSQDDRFFEDYLKFAKLLNNNIEVGVDGISEVKELRSGIKLYLGWAKGNAKYLTK